MVNKTNKSLKKALSLSLSVVLTVGMIASMFGAGKVSAGFTTMSIRPSTIAVNGTPQILVKIVPSAASTPAVTGVENNVILTFPSYTVAAFGSITVTTAGIASWDSTCTNALPGIGATATAASNVAKTATFASGDLTAATPYCFIITAGITNPAAAGNNLITVNTRTAALATIDSSSMSIPTITNDVVQVTASVASFVRCNVTTTVGGDNATDLGTLQYGTISSSADDIQIQGGTNAAAGMTWYYRTSGANNGLYSTTKSALISGNGTAGKLTLSPTTADCGTSACFGIFHNGTTSAATGSFVPNASFTGGTTTTQVGPMTTSIFGTPIGSSNNTVASQVIANFEVNATAGESTPTDTYTGGATGYQANLIFTCKADL